MPVSEALLCSLGYAVFAFLSVLGPLLASDHGEIYHFDGPVSALFAPALLDVALLWLLIAVIFLALRSLRARLFFFAVLIGALPWGALKSWSSLLAAPLPHAVSLPTALLPLLFLGLAVLFSRRAAEILPAARAASVCLGLSGAVILFQTGVAWFRASGADTVSASSLVPSSPRAPGAPGRVIVLLLDELSFDQVFAHRPAGLALPAIDALAAESTVFTAVAPAAPYTDDAVPSLLTGLRIESSRPSPDGRVLAFRDGSSWTSVPPRETLFSDAQAAGFPAGVAGWHIPYCRLFASVLHRCSWSSRFDVRPFAPDERSVLLNAWEPFARVFRSGPHFLGLASAPPADTRGFAHHREDFLRIQAGGDSLLRDPSIGLVFLHLPIPHGGSLFLRRRNALAPGGSYLDNLALTDLYLASIRKQLEQADAWQSSAVLVMGDHSWRTWLYRGSPDWTSEDERASGGGRFDPRPLLLLKLPGQNSATRMDLPFNALDTRALLREVMAGQLRTPDRLRSWVLTRPAASLPALDLASAGVCPARPGGPLAPLLRFAPDYEELAWEGCHQLLGNTQPLGHP